MSIPTKITIKGIFIKEEDETKTQGKATAEDLLLLSGFKRLMVWRITGGEIGVCFESCEVKDGMFLNGTYGTGNTISEACEDYLKKIRGKTLVFNSYADYREEIKVL